MYIKLIKPIADFIISILLLFTLSPVIILIAICLLISNAGANIFFFQKRPGLNGKPFVIIKFKTMRDIYDEKGKLLPDEQRLTKIGLIVRSLSLDELLQLINVIKGEMSIIGPRPLLMHYLPRYSKEQYKRHNVKPGITGWAQVNGRNNLNWDQKFYFDIEYVNKISFWLDLKILFMTFIKVIRRNGINANNSTTMSEFLG